MFRFSYHSSTVSHLADSMVENSIFQRKEIESLYTREPGRRDTCYTLDFFQTFIVYENQ